jgi:guanosine-3',5'-bis(diphosphate) 3'-pyrophosphohydrolase
MNSKWISEQEYPEKRGFYKVVIGGVETIAEMGPAGWLLGSPDGLSVHLMLDRKNNIESWSRFRDFVEQAEFYAASAHWNQKRKYTGEPYFNHVAAVAEIVKSHGGDPAMIAAAYLHDTVEDTSVEPMDLHWAFGEDIANLVYELTNVYDKKSYPELNRERRHALESVRLGGVSARAQTVKFADFLNNGSDILVQDPKFAQVYIQEVSLSIRLMTLGNPDLRNKVIEMIFDIWP